MGKFEGFKHVCYYKLRVFCDLKSYTKKPILIVKMIEAREKKLILLDLVRLNCQI